MYSESAHLDGIALCLYYGKPQHNKVVVLNLADFDVKRAKAKKLRNLDPTLNLHAALTRGSSFILTPHDLY